MPLGGKCLFSLLPSFCLSLILKAGRSLSVTCCLLLCPARQGRTESSKKEAVSQHRTKNGEEATKTKETTPDREMEAEDRKVRRERAESDEPRHEKLCQRVKN